MANGNGNAELPPGYTLQGRYTIQCKLADGGMGVVYKANDTYLSNRPVAVKEMKQPGANKGTLDVHEAVRLFKLEAAILSGLNHPNLPHVYGTLQDAGNYYLVMDFIEGETLLQRIKNAWGQPLEMKKVLHYAIQLCDILDYLHNQRPQIIFRDLKPANIIINSSGRVFLIDFGIARHFKPHQSGDTIVIGTPGYADPEISQLKQTNPRSDLYSLGATLHHCLTGQSPNYVSSHFRFPSVYDYNRSVPIEFDRLILKLVEPQSKGRPASARQVKQQLLQIQKTIVGDSATGTIPIDNDEVTVADNGLTPPGGASPLQPLAAALKGFSGLIAGGFSALAAPVFAPLAAGSKSLVDLFWQVLPPGTSWSSYSPIWQPRFLVLLGSLLALMSGTGIYLSRVFHNSFYAVDLCLSLLLLFTVFILRNTISERVPRSILTASGVPVVVCILALLLQPIVSSPVHPSSSPPLTVSQVLTWVLLALALLALVGGFITSLLQAYVQQARWRVWVDRLALFALTGTWTFLQYFSGSSEHLPFNGNGVSLLAMRISFEMSPQNTTAVTVNQLLCIPPALITLMLLLRSKSKITAGDRRLLFLAAIPYVLLQWNYGAGEMLHLFPASGLATATAINVVLFVLLIVAVFVMLRPELDRLDLLDRAALLLLMLSSASLQSFLTGNGGNVELPLLSTQLPATSFSTLLTIVLLAAALLLLVRTGRALNALDRITWAALALSCAAIEFAYGQQQAQHVGQTSLNADPAAANAIARADLHQLLALLLVCLVIASILLAIIQGLLPASERNPSTERPLRWVDRFTMLALVLASSLLLFAFNSEQLLPYITHPALLGSMTTSNTPLVLTLSNFALAVLLLLVDIAAMFRFFKPLGKGDRWIFLACDLTCILLLLGNTAVQHLPLLVWKTNHLTGGWSQLLTMSTLVSAGLIITALLSLRWLARPFEPLDRLILSFVFLAAVAFALLQISHTQFFLALLALILGVLIAAQIERVRTGTRFV